MSTLLMKTMAFLIFFCRMITCANIDNGNYILASKYILCKNDPNFRNQKDQLTILSLTIRETNELFRRTKIKVFKDPKYSKMPEIAPYEIVFLPEDSFLCTTNVTLNVSLYNQLVQMNIFSRLYPNILLIPNYINEYFFDFKRDYYGYARYGSAYIDDAVQLPNGRLLNIFFISTIIYRIHGFKSLKLLHQHEIGHGFVGPHDPEDVNEPQHFGSYLMGSNFLELQGNNNNHFSNESVLAITQKIKHVIQKFQNWLYYGYKTCGNGMIEDGETCDTIRNMDDPNNYCDKTCQLNAPYLCSPLNHRCCNDSGLIEKTNKECFHEERSRCLKASKCNGKNYDCPMPEYFEKDTICDTGKRCSSDGHCLFERCERPEDECDCQIDGIRNPCMTCCLKNNGTSCERLSAKLDGTPCSSDMFVVGQCVKGECSQFIYYREDHDKGEDSSRTRNILYQVALFTFTLLFAIITGHFFYCYKKTKSPKKSEKIELSNFNSRPESEFFSRDNEQEWNENRHDNFQNDTDEDEGERLEGRTMRNGSKKHVSMAPIKQTNDDDIQSIA